MAVLVTIRRQKAFLRRGEWVCADSKLERQLNAATADWFQNRRAGKLGKKDPEHILAAEIVHRFGGRILLQTQPNVRVNRRIYFSKLQMELDFEVNPV